MRTAAELDQVARRAASRHALDVQRRRLAASLAPLERRTEAAAPAPVEVTIAAPVEVRVIERPTYRVDLVRDQAGQLVQAFVSPEAAS